MSYFEAQNISIRFGGLAALSAVGFEVEKGDVFSIIGPNGAGKTTIFNCMSRFYNLSEGILSFKKKDITHIPPHKVAELGIARTFQNIELFSNMTVVDNLMLGQHRMRSSNILSEILFTSGVKRQELESREKVERIVDILKLQAYREQPISSLPYGVQKMVELGRALSMDPELLLLDEPSSGLNVEETEDLAFWIEDIKHKFDSTIILVEHNIRLVKEVSDHVMALNFGEIITQGKPDEVLSHPEVMRAYLGENEDASIENQ